MPVIKIETYIKAPIGRVFDLGRSVDVHMAGSKATGERVVEGRKSGLIVLSDVINWEGDHFGVRQRLTAKVIAYEHQKMFKDVLLKGAFASIEHTHRFTEVDDGTVMTDELRHSGYSEGLLSLFYSRVTCAAFWKEKTLSSKK